VRWSRRDKNLVVVGAGANWNVLNTFYSDNLSIPYRTRTELIMPSLRRRNALFTTLVAVSVAVAGCSTSSDSSTPGSTGAGTASVPTSSAAVTATLTGPSPSLSSTCTPTTMKTLTPGTLTFAADQPVYEPWFVKNDPTNGQGYESAVAYAVAAKLGFTKSAVKWKRETFDSAIAPGPKKFDADLDEFSITAARQKVVDFSSGYYDVTQAVVALKGSKAAAVTTLAALKSLKLGAQVGTTSYEAIVNQIKPSKTASVFNTNSDAVTALKNKQIDGLVVDLPTAFEVIGGDIDNGVIVGQLPQDTAAPEQFGILLNKGSSLTSCMSQAVDSLRSDGTLHSLAQKWLTQTGNAPDLK
jgi:polar amino acid transport system substrate-binding protein